MIRTPLSTVIGGAKLSSETVMKKLSQTTNRASSTTLTILTEEKINWRKNLILYSEEFSSNVWGLSNSSLTVNSITALMVQ